MLTRQRLLDFLIPFVAVGAAALTARLRPTGDEGAPALYLVLVVGIAFLTGLRRPSLIGTLGAWLGCSAGISLGWLIADGFVWLDGPAAYALIVVPAHALATLLRTGLRPRGRPATV